MNQCKCPSCRTLWGWFDAALIAVFILITAGALGAVAYRDALANLHDYGQRRVVP